MVVALGCLPACGPNIGPTHPFAGGESLSAPTTATRQEPRNVLDALPASPDFPSPTVPDRYSDGAWSIAGLRKDLDARLAEGEGGTPIVVRAWVQSVYAAPPCPDGRICPPPKQPHAWLVDHEDEAGTRRSLMLTGFRFQIPQWDETRWKTQPTVELMAGRQTTIKGRLQRRTSSGFAADTGVFETVAVFDEATRTWVVPPGAPSHPLEAKRSEEEREQILRQAQEHQREHNRRK